MDLNSLIIDTKTAWIEYPGLDGFKVEVSALARKELMALRKRCTSTKIDRKTRAAVEELDEEKYVKEFTRAAVKNWKGLKLKYLEELMLVDLSGKDLEAELDFSEANADSLVNNSVEFDGWLTEAVLELDNFRTATKGPDLVKAGKVV